MTHVYHKAGLYAYTEDFPCERREPEGQEHPKQNLRARHKMTASNAWGYIITTSNMA